MHNKRSVVHSSNKYLAFRTRETTMLLPVRGIVADWRKNMAYSRRKQEFILTDYGKRAVKDYIAELAAKRKEILDAGKDTAEETELPTMEDIIADVNSLGIDDSGEYYNGWGVTDHYDADLPILLKIGRDLEAIYA